MLFNISPQNAEKAKKAFTTARPAHVYGYTQSAILTPKNHRMKCCYQIDILHDIIVCTIRHQEAETVEAVITARAFTDNSIEIERAELYRNASNYPYRTETNDRYMRKYDQIACIIHGAISAGLLFDVSEKPQETTEATTAQNTTCTDREPQRATEDAQTTTESRHKYGMRLRGYSIGAQPAGVVERADDHTGLYYDIITYNRELTPEELDMYSLTPLEAPTAPEIVTGKEEPTTAGKDAQRATETATDNHTASNGEPHAAYIVQCRSKRRPWTDYSSPATLEECEQIKERAEARHVLNQNGEPIMYRIATTPSTTGDHTTQTAHNAPERTETTEAEHVPTVTQTEPTRATDASTTGRADRKTTRATPPRHTCENAPGRAERHGAEHVHTAHAKSPPRGTGSAADHRQRGRPDRRKGTFSGRMQKRVHIYRSILGVPIYNQDF